MPIKVNHRWSSGEYFATQVNGSDRILISHNSYGYQWDDIRIGSTLPGYRYLIHTGQDATTGLVAHRETNSGVNGDASLYYDTLISPTVTRRDGSEATGQLYGGLLPWIGTASYSSSSVDTDARMKFLKKYREKRTAFQSGTFFGELAEAVHMIRSPAKALRSSLNSYHSVVSKRLKGLGWGGSKRVRQDIADRAVAETWLEYSYGVRPFISDIADAVKVLDASPTSYSEVISAQAESDSDYGVLRVFGSFGPMSYWSDLVYKGKVSVRYKGAVSGTISPPGFAEQIGVSWSNVLPTVWELIPYSFLVDYFTNVGDIISGVSEGIIRLNWGNKTLRTTVTREVSRSAVTHSLNASQNPTSYISVPPNKSEFVNIERARVTHIGVGLSDFHFRAPGVGSTKWLNIAALARLKTL